MKLPVDTFKCGGLRGCLQLGRYYLAKIRSQLSGPGRECPICHWTGPEFRPIFFLPDAVTRSRVRCPRCGSFERHRAYFLFYRDFLALPENARLKRILHFAPEECLAGGLRTLASEYVKSSYENPGPDELSLDLRDLALGDGSFDLLVMNYVLSCMPEDEKAVKSMWRVLSAGGVVLAGDSVAEGRETIDFAEIKYGGAHRSYGTSDLKQRFAPFEVTVVDAASAVPESDKERYGFNPDSRMIVLRKTEHPSCHEKQGHA